MIVFTMHNFQKYFLDTFSKSDKLYHHGYHRIYTWFLGQFKNQSVSIFEIGVEDQNSIKLWQFYFQKVKIYCIDINEKHFDDKSINFYQLDQSNDNQLSDFSRNIDVKFDIIL
jgi:hypothetical protein